MENRISVTILAGRLSTATGRGKKACEDFIREFFKLAAESLGNGENIRIKGFGTFKIAIVESRGSVDVSTGQPTEIKSHKKVIFTPSKEMAGVINAPFEIFESVELDDNTDKGSPDEVLSKDGEQVEKGILEAGSEEEGLDDDITYEAYTESSEEKTDIVDPVETIKSVASQTEPVNESRLHTIPETENSTHVLGTQDDREPQIVYVEGKSNYGKGFITGALSVLVVCLVIFSLGCFLSWWPVNLGSPKEIKGKVATELIPVEKESLQEMPDTVGTEMIAAEETETIYDTVSTTRYLTTIAREHYGNFNFWPYIYIENERILGHPDRITPGTKVVVPSLKKYGVDPANKEDEKTAKAKGLEIYSKFKGKK